MATFKAEVQNKRKDGTYNVRIRVTHNREVRRLSTNIYVTSTDLTRGLKIKSMTVLNQCEDLITQYRKACNDLGFAVENMGVDELVNRLKTVLSGGDRFKLNFISYIREKAEQMSKGTAGTYINSMNSLQRFIKRDYLDIAEITTSFLKDYERFLESEPSMRGSNRKKDNKEIGGKGERAISLYISCIRAIHNKAKSEYNDEDRGIILIPYSPFKNYKIKPQPRTRKRAVSIDVIQSIINLPYKNESIGGKWSRYNLAKDCFILSFALIGMNSADMYHASKIKSGVVIYNRRKTESRREDNAEMRVRVEPEIQGLLNKYTDSSKIKMFGFYNHYSTQSIFNNAINKGLKQIGDILGIDNLTFYVARYRNYSYQLKMSELQN